MTIVHFGTLPDGRPVEKVSLKNGDLSANFLNWGAILQDLRLDGHAPALVLGFPELSSYLNHSAYFGAVVGRFANRINNGRFFLDGNKVQLDQNFMGKHMLHGGANGLDKRLWTITDHSAASLTLMLDDTNGEMGFPANVRHTCIYSLQADGTLDIQLSAKPDASTPINLTQHSYFTFNAGRDCRTAHLQIEAENFLETNAELIPTGNLINVAQTPNDFRKPKPIARDLQGGWVYDCNFCAAHQRRSITRIARAYDEEAGLEMIVSSTEPGLQFFAAHQLDTSAKGLDGRCYGNFAGFALEAQNWPDAPNHPHFPSSIVSAGETLQQHTQYQFRHLKEV